MTSSYFTSCDIAWV